jgi:hypothetical protein
MFYRFLGRIFLYFWVLPFFYQIGKYIFGKLMILTAKNVNDPNWTLQKELTKFFADRAERLLFGEGGMRGLSDDIKNRHRKESARL